MTTGLKLIRCGPWVSIQDRGRPGYQRYGVSESGAMDPVSLEVANRLVENAPGDAALEIGAPGLTLSPVETDVTVGIAGDAVRVWLDKTQMAGNRGFRLSPGQALRVTPDPSSAFAYMSVRGGFDLKPAFGSLSFHARSGIGGTGKGPLGEGTILPVRGPASAEHDLIGTLPQRPERIALLPGPQFDHLESASWTELLERPWTIGARSDRMGLRLEGPRLHHTAKGFNIVSDGIALGSLQLPGDGKPIVLAADRQTTGGYPKVAVIARAEMHHFAQLPPGAEVRFREVTHEQSIELLHALRRRIDSLRVGPVSRSLDSTWLLSVNLIDGVIRE